MFNDKVVEGEKLNIFCILTFYAGPIGNELNL